MSANDDDLLATISLDALEWRGILELANAIDEFEPLAKRGNLGETVANRLVSIGLAETGLATSRYGSIGLASGYRLTALGWRVKERGRHPRRLR